MTKPLKVGALTQAYGWSSRVAALVEHSAAGLDGLWALVQAAEIAVIRINSDPMASADQLTASLDLREAIGELDWLHPELEQRSMTADLGPPAAGEDPRRCVQVLLTAALVMCGGLAADQRAPTDELAMLSRVSTLLAAAERRVGGASG